MPDWADNRTSTSGLGALIGTAASAVSGGALSVLINGQAVTVRAASSLTVTVGQSVLIHRVGSTFVATDVVPAAPAAPSTPIASVTDTPTTGGDPSPPSQPTTTTGTLVCSPVSTASYRDSSWRADGSPVDAFDTYQGRYSGSSYGRSTGCVFYGTKPQTLSGATVTAATIRVLRLAAGDYGVRTATLWCLTEATRPSGAPTLNETTTGPALGVQNQVSPWENDAFAIPTAWAQAMVGGTRGGLAIEIGSDTPYMCLAGLGSWSAAWTLSINWQRGS